jgi:hypothetical protein
MCIKSSQEKILQQRPDSDNLFDKLRTLWQWPPRRGILETIKYFLHTLKDKKEIS